MRILYNDGKWDGLWDKPKYQEIRNKIVNEFKDLTFVEEGHKYFLHGKEVTCVSNVTHMFKEPFNSHEKAIETYERNYNNAKSKYYQMTAEEIERAWKENSEQACEHGSLRHAFSESCFYFMTRQYDKILPEYKDRLTEDGGFKAIFPKEEAAVRFYEDLPQCFIPILAETKVYATYSGERTYSGTFDLLTYYDAELIGRPAKFSGLVVMDWKTNKDLFKNFKEQHLLEPLDGLLDMPVSLYKAQLSLYENALYKIGMKVVGRRLMWLKPNGTYERIELESYRRRLDEWLEKNF